MKTTLFLLLSICFSVCIYASQNQYVTPEDKAILEKNWEIFQQKGIQLYKDYTEITFYINANKNKIENLETELLHASFFKRAKISIQMNITKRRLTRLQKRLMPVNIQYQSFRCTQFALQSTERATKKFLISVYSRANYNALKIAKQYEKDIEEYINFLNNLSESQINKTKKYEEKLKQYNNDIQKSKENISKSAKDLKESFKPNKIKPRGEIISNLTKSSFKLAWSEVKNTTYKVWNINQKTYTELQVEKALFNIALRFLKSVTNEKLEQMKQKELEQERIRKEKGLDEDW